MKEGTIAAAINSVGDWPPTSDLEVIRQLDSDYLIVVTAHPNSQLSIKISSQEEIISFLSQEIQFKAAKSMRLIISWSQEEIERVFINGKVLPSFECEGYFEVISNYELDGRISSFEDPSVNDACKIWVEWRKRKYSYQKVESDDGRRIKTIEEQVDELSRALSSFEDSVLSN